ncbi:hypothetical protein EG329_014085 [Mollisiaceae sp. DMI_Dod_QoI]|nr:hypothetical protein EG329_014085 [Helotiales sp. DMI_Dod_QoI]
MLGAKWFDSRDRYGFIANVADDEEPELSLLETGMAKVPTTMERRWVSVGYPSANESGGKEGGFWVLEFDTVMYGMQEKQNLFKTEANMVWLAKTMDMKCEILRSLGARFFAGLEEYDGAACLKAWEEKMEGEFGPLVKTRYGEVNVKRGFLDGFFVVIY